MSAVQEHLDGLPERQLADRLMSIAESASVRALGVACCSAITELTGSPTVGLYLLDGLEPELAYSRHVAEGLLDNYRAGFWRHDPVLDCIMTRGRAVDGETVIGPQQWRHSPSFEMLHEWGLHTTWAGHCGAGIRSSACCLLRRPTRTRLTRCGRGSAWRCCVGPVRWL
ncbi:hypothetical protein ACTGJ9_028785 [Bradyrhizobium sp. RDM12]